MTYDPELYQLVHRGNPGDVAFYRRACESAASVLELACGFGRVLGALGSEGRLLVGLDRDRRLLATARARLPRETGLVRADMSDFWLRARFDRVLAPYGTLYNLDAEALGRCLRTVRELLADGGRLVFDAWSADAFHEESAPEDLADDALVPVVSVEHAGKRWDVFERSRWDREAQRVEATYVHVARDGTDVVEGTITHRYLLHDQVAPVLAEAGLEVEAIHGDFATTPWTRDSEHLVVVAGRDLSEGRVSAESGPSSGRDSGEGRVSAESGPSSGRDLGEGGFRRRAVRLPEGSEAAQRLVGGRARRARWPGA